MAAAPGAGGGPGGPGGPRPPDFEDFIRKGQDRFKRSVIPAAWAAAWASALIILGLGSWSGRTGFYRVNPGEQGVVLRFGEWVNHPVAAGPALAPALSDRDRDHAAGDIRSGRSTSASDSVAARLAASSRRRPKKA